MEHADASTTLLLAEDNDDLRQLMATVLRQGGHQVLEARNEDEWTSVLNTHPHIDVVVADITMPGKHDGVELVHRARRDNPELPVLLITGKPFEDVKLPRGAGYLAKPFQAEELTRYVDAAIRAARGEVKAEYY